MKSIADRVAPPELDRTLPDLIEPHWWTGEPAIDPARFTHDARRLSSDEMLPILQSTYNEFGIVRLVGVDDLEQTRELADELLGGGMNYEAGANPRDVIEANVYEVGAPLTAWLHYHHEMAYVGRSPQALGFICRSAPSTGGETYFSDNVAATGYLLTTELGQKLRDRGVCYHRNLTDRRAFDGQLEVGVYNHWQKSFATEDMAEAEAKAIERGLQTSWGPNNLLQTRYYADAFEYFAPMDRNLLFASVADHGMWFDGWPLVMHLPYDQRPLAMTYGDDTPFSAQDLRDFVDVYDRFGIRNDWQVGDLVVFCNYRFAHGRPGINLAEGESRELGVMLGADFDRVGQLPGKF